MFFLSMSGILKGGFVMFAEKKVYLLYWIKVFVMNV